MVAYSATLSYNKVRHFKPMGGIAKHIRRRPNMAQCRIYKQKIKAVKQYGYSRKPKKQT